MPFFPSRLTRRGRSSSCRKRRPRLEQLEDRQLLASLMVTINGDSGPGSLRQAILDADASQVSSTIDFNIGGSSGNGVEVISPLSALPDITVPVTIDATTQPGYTGTPLIVLDGSGQAGGGDGFTFAAASDSTVGAAGSSVKGFVIGNFANNGITVFSGGVTLQGNYIGVAQDGKTAMPNAGDGILIIGAAGDLVGGTNAGQGNVISGNGVVGIESGVNYSGSESDLIEGNIIGLDAAGDAELGNGQDGVFAHGPATIGGTEPGARNIISGNQRFGIFGVWPSFSCRATTSGPISPVLAAASEITTTGLSLRGRARSGGLSRRLGMSSRETTATGCIFSAQRTCPGSNVVVEGNYVGTDWTGTQPLGNGADGIRTESNVQIGGDGPARRAGNVISGGNYIGIYVEGADDLVEGNFIGTDDTGPQPAGKFDRDSGRRRKQPCHRRR